VGLLLPNSPPFIIGYYAIPESGGNCCQPESPFRGAGDPSFPESCRDPDSHRRRTAFPRIAEIAGQSSLENILVACLRSGGSKKPPEKSKIVAPSGKKKGVRLLEPLLEKYSGKRIPVVSLEPEDEAVLQYTGAISEGIKGVVLTHGNLVANTLQIRSWVVGRGREKRLSSRCFPSSMFTGWPWP